MDTVAQFHRDRVTISGDVQIAVQRLAVDTGKVGDFSDRQSPFVVSLLSPPDRNGAELALPSTFSTSGEVESRPLCAQVRIGGGYPTLSTPALWRKEWAA